MKKNKMISIALLVASVVLAVVSWFLLPDSVVTQISLNAEGATRMPKAAAVALPLLLGGGGAVAALAGNTPKKAWLVSGVGVAVFVVMLAVNLA